VVVTLAAHHQPIVLLDRRVVVFAAVLVLAVCGVLLGLSVGNGAAPGTSFETPAATVSTP
jgi:hypothetical protein